MDEFLFPMTVPHASQRSTLGLAILMLLGLVVACGTEKHSPLPFADDEVLQVELLQLEHPLLGGVLKREMLATDRIPELMRAMRNSRHFGLLKIWTPYLLKIKLQDGGIVEFKAADSRFSPREIDDYYEFDGGGAFLRKFFPRFFE